MRFYGLFGRGIGQDRLAKTTSPYIKGVSVLVSVPTSTSTENERNHQPNLLLYTIYLWFDWM